MLKSSLRKSLSFAFSLSLVASLLIASQQISRADDVEQLCSGGYGPIFSGRVVDTSGRALPDLQIQAVTEIDFGDNQINSVSSWGQSDQAGNYEICPSLSDTGLPAPSPIVGSFIYFTAFDAVDSSVSINKFEVTEDVRACIESGGPCMFDLVLKQGTPIVVRGMDPQSNSSLPTFQGLLNLVGQRLDDEGNAVTVLKELASMSQPASDGTFKVYGATAGEYRLVIFPTEQELLMDSAWQIVVSDDNTSTVKNLNGRGDGDGYIWYNASFGTEPIQKNANGIYELPFGLAKMKFMLTDGVAPLSTEHIAQPVDYALVTQLGSDSTIRFADDTSCWPISASDPNPNCLGNLDTNPAGEILAPWENGFFRFGVDFGYNVQGVSTQFVMKIEDREIISVWRNFGYRLDEVDGQVMNWQEIDLVSDISGVSNGLTLHQHDLGAKLANYVQGDLWINGTLCLFAGQCNADEMPSDQFSLHGGIISEIGQIAFPNASMLGVSCDDSTNGTDPELQLLVDAGGWSPANSTSSRYAIDCSGEFGNRNFEGYELQGVGVGKTAGERVDLQNLSLNTAQVIGLVKDPDGRPINTNNVEFYPIDANGLRVQSDDEYSQNLNIQNYWGSNSDHVGKFNLSALVTGSYALTFGVDDENSENFGAFGKIRFDVVVSNDGTITSAKYGTSLSETPESDALVDPIEVTLTAPNFVGTMLSQNGKPRSYQWFQVYKHDSESIMNDNEGYVHFPDARNTMSYGAGAVAIYLQEGQYKISLPAAAGNPKTDFEIWVDSAGSICPLEAQTGNDLCGVKAVSNWSLRYAQPNLTGTVTADNTPTPAQVNVYTRNSSGWWQSVDWIHASDGEFAARLATSGYYRLELEPQSWTNTGEQPLEGFVKTFAYVKVDSNKKLCTVPASTDFDSQLANCPIEATRELIANFPLGMASLTIRVKAPTSSTNVPQPAQWTGLDVRETTSNQFIGENLWTHTNANGKAFLNLPQKQGQTRFFEVTVRPNGSGNGLMLASKVLKFCTTGNGNVYSVVAEACSTTQAIASLIEVVLAEGNLKGRIKTSGNQDLPANANAYADVRIWDNTCPSCFGNSNTWGWKWNNNLLNNSGNGAFGGDLEPGTYLVKASTWRSNYAPGSAIIRVGTNEEGEHPWCLVAADAEVLDIPEYNNSEANLQTQIRSADDLGVIGVKDCNPISDAATSLNVSLKSPNVSGTLTDPSGANIKNAWGNIYKITGNNNWNREYVSNFSVQSGKFVGRVKLPTSGELTYGIQFEQPQGQVGSRFAITLNCTISDCVYTPGVGQPQQPSESLTLSYPAPNFLGRICSPDSVAARPSTGEDDPGDSYVCDAVKNSHLSIQTYSNGNWQWGNIWANTNSRGEVSLTLPNGRYRATAYPSWNNPKGVQTNVEFSIVGELASFNPNVDKDTESPATLDMQLLGPNLSGTLKFKQGSETRIMQYGGVSASLRCTTDCPTSWEDRWAWTSADRNGSYRLLLPSNGTWDVWVYANSSQNPKPPMRMTAFVEGGKVKTWDYYSPVITGFENPDLGEVNFDALPANLTVTITGTSEIRIVKFKDNQGNPINELTTYSSGGTSNTISTRAPAGTYTVEVLRSSRESSVGTSAPVVVPVGNSLTTISVSVN